MPRPYLSLLILTLATPALAEPLTPERYADEPALANWLWLHSTDVLEARGLVSQAGVDVARAAARPNPAVDLTIGTIPLGTPNPPNLRDPLLHVPNYGIGLRQILEPGKRQPRVAYAQAGVELAGAQAADVATARFFDLLAAIGHVALAQMRQAAFDGLIASSTQLLEVQRNRAKKGDISGQDLTRFEVEHQRLVVQRASLDQALAEALADCAQLTATRCESFASADAARAWLQHETVPEPPATWDAAIEQNRTDLRVLEAKQAAAHKQVQLGRSLVYPDVEARLAYLYDTFQVSGNQQQSVTLGVGLTLPVFSRGQADLQAASVTMENAANLRRARIDAGRAALESAQRRRQLALQRTRQLDEAIARAAKLVEELTETLRRGAVSLADVVIARRAWQELVLEREDIDADLLTATLDARRAAGQAPHARP